MTNPASYEYDIFLSYNRTDEEWTARLAELLEQENWQGRKLRVFFAPWDIVAGQSIPQRIEEALPKSRKVGLVMSPEAMASEWVKLERLVTTYIAISERQERLIPLLRRDCEIPPLAKPLLYVDFRDNAQFEESYQSLLSVVKDEPTPRRAPKPANVSVSLPTSIPRPPVVGFVARRDRDRRDIVERLRDELAPHKNQVVALWGAGGVGKTTLASEAVRSLAEAFAQQVVWISADQRSNLPFATFLDEIAAQLGDEDLRRLALEQKIEAVRALINVAPTLIVLDNFETITPEDQLQCMEFLAEQARCTALITTRQKVERAVAIPIAAMSTEEANDFLQRLIDQTQDPDIYAELDRNRLIQTAEANPLIIQWIVGQIDLAHDPEEVLNELSHGEGDAAHRVFTRSFNLRQMADGGRAVLLALSLFTPSATRSALAEVAGMGKDKDKKRFKKAQETLASLWLIKKTEAGQRLSVAGLTRELTKAHLPADPRNKTFRLRFTARFLKYAEDNRNPTTEHLNALEDEKDNILSAMDVAFGLNDLSSAMRLMDAINFDGVNGLLTVRGYWDDAIQRGEQVLKAAHNLQNEEAVAQFAHNMAIIFQNRGELEEARRLYAESLDISKRRGNRIGIAVTLHQIAILAQEQGELEEARRLYNESLEIKKNLGDQSGISTTLHNLATIAQGQGDLEEAQLLYNESLEIKKRLGDQSGIASTLHQTAILAQNQGELDEARRLYNESLEINKRLGNQSGIASTLHQMALLAHEGGELDAAWRLYGESIEINKGLGDQSGIAITLLALGGLAQGQGELEEARRLYNESLEIKKKLGNQGGIANTLHELGRLAQDQGKLEEARRLYNESLEIRKKLGNQSGIASTLHELGRLAQDQGKLEEARRLYNESLEIRKKLGDQSGIAASLHELGIICLAEGNIEESENLLNQSLLIFRKLSHKQNIAECLESIGRLRSAQGLFIEAHDLFNESLGVALPLGDKFRVASVRRSLGLLAEKGNEKDKAAELLREAFSGFESLKSPKAEETRRDLERVESEVA